MSTRSILGCALLVFSSLAQASSYDPPEPYDLKISKSEAREVLNLILEDLRFHPDGYQKPEVEGSIYAQRLLTAYRFDGEKTDLAIKDGPFPTFLIGMQLDPIYAEAYKSSYKTEYDRVVVNTPVDVILDGFMQGILDDSLPPSYKDQADQIGKCLAKKVMAGNRPGCALDPNADEPAFLTKAWVKLSCPFGLASDCYSRQVIYRAAKTQLNDALKDPSVRDLVKRGFLKQFPTEFASQFVKKLNEQVAGFPDLIVRKFNGESVDAWTKRGRLFEGEAGDQLSLRDAFAGIRADLGVAAFLVKSEEPKDRGLAAALFYGAANRFIVLMGGKEAKLGKNGLEFSGNQPLDPKNPENPQGAPIPVLADFGGWSARKDGNHTVFVPWDFKTYDPAKGFQLFPSVFKLEDRFKAETAEGEPYETLEDIAELIYSSLEFLRQTRPDGPFGSFFGGMDLAKILDPTSPVVFPSAGRQMVMGILGVALKNIKASSLGHIEPVTGNLIVFHDRVTLGGRDNSNPRVEAVAHVLTKGADFGKILNGDPDAPADLAAAVKDVEVAVQAGTFVLCSKGQGPDGGFYELMSGPNNGEKRTLKTAIAGMTALTRVYNRGHTLAFRLLLREAWKFLDRFWVDQGIIPRPIEDVRPQELSPVLAWSLIRLWDETQASVRPDLASEIEWKHWQDRFDGMHARLIEQLRDDYGPRSLKP